MRLMVFFISFLIPFLPMSGRSSEPAHHAINYKDHFRFIENKGQYPEDILFKAAVPGGSVYLARNYIAYSFFDMAALNQDHNCKTCGHSHRARLSKQKINAHGYRIEIAGSTPRGKAAGRNAGSETYNYFLGSDPGRWAVKAKAYKEVYYENIYPNVDLRLYGGPKGLKYDFIVKSGADLSAIKLRYEGPDNLFLQANRLHISTSVNQLVEEIPLAYQMAEKDTVRIHCNYRLEDNVLSFQAGAYNRESDLVIDPLLVFSTFSGATADNWGNTATYDNEGNLYSGGIIDNFDTLISPGAAQIDFGGAWDVCILKFDSTGRDLKYATYLGGTEAETPQSMVVNNKGELLIFGTTSSLDYPVTENAFDRQPKGGASTEALPGIYYRYGSDMFISKLSEDGSQLVSSTLMGGAGNDGIIYTLDPLVKNYGDQYRGDIFVDAEDYVYVASNTSSADFPIKNAWQPTFSGGARDGVVFKMSPGLSELIWSSYLGGSDTDAAYSIKVNDLGIVYVAGGTLSGDFQTTPSAYISAKPGDIDGFVVKINQQSMTLEQSTFIGTPAYDQVYFLDLDRQGFVYLLGQTQGDYPVKARTGAMLYENPGSGQFIHKLASNLIFDDNCFSTVFGSGSGSPDISLTAFMVNECGDIFLSGWGGNINAPDYEGHLTRYVGGNTYGLPVTHDAEKDTTDGSDFYLMTLHADAQAVMYATFFGGTTTPGEPGEHVDGGTSRFDKKGIVYQAVCAACREGLDSDFPHTPGVWSSQNLSSNCNNAAFKFDMASLIANFETNSIYFDQPGLDEGCFPLDVIFINKSIGGKNFFWEFGNGSTSTRKDTVRVRFSEPGIYYATLIATDPGTCKKIDYVTRFINVYNHGFSVVPSDTICLGNEMQLYATGGDDYVWSPAESLSDPFIADPVANPQSTTHYIVKATNEFNCKLIDTVSIFILPPVKAEIEYRKSFDQCRGMPTVLFSNKSPGDTEFAWNFGDGSLSSEKNPEYRYSKEGIYQVTLATGGGNCSSDTTVAVSIGELSFPNVITPNGDQFNEAFSIGADGLEIEIYNRWGNRVYQSDNYQNDWRGDDLPSGIYYIKITFADQSGCNGWVHLLR